MTTFDDVVRFAAEHGLSLRFVPADGSLSAAAAELGVDLKPEDVDESRLVLRVYMDRPSWASDPWWYCVHTVPLEELDDEDHWDEILVAIKYALKAHPSARR